LKIENEREREREIWDGWRLCGACGCELVFFSCCDDDDMPFFLLRPPGAKQQKSIFGFLPTKKVHLSLSLSLCRTSFVFAPLGRLALWDKTVLRSYPIFCFWFFCAANSAVLWSEGSCRSLGVLFVFLRYGYYYFEHVFFLCWCRIRVPGETLA
jgi:hypothetical protein